MSHGNARLTVHGRRLIVQRHQAGWKQAHIASAMGVSRKCVKTWIDRYAAEGEDGLVGVYVNGLEIYGGLSRDEARRRRWRIWWALPAQRAAARERITAG